MLMRWGLVAGALVFALAGCGGGAEAEPADPSKLDEAGRFACEDFAKDYRSAVTRQARVDLAGKVAEWGTRSRTNRIADMSRALGNAADGSEGAWKLAADAFAQACLDAGYKAR